MKPEELAAYYAQKYPLTVTEDSSHTDEHLCKRYEEAWELARKAAALLKQTYGAKRVAVFGSVAHRTFFTRWSDIDLAAWGIPDDRFYAAVAAVTGLSPDFKVDLVDALTCRDSLIKAIEDEGIEL
ncbi:MAG: nucleotidyltransferase domain-containing protein [Actinobacteria bacterium]|nr:nucleotidyltransferase domain-containing protein [Actinomycetota bacterium]